jgi:hypothetical protein
MNDSIALSKSTVSYGLSLAVVSVINGLLVVAKESSPAVMSGMAHIMGHHWITHSTLMLVLFFAFAWIFGRANGSLGVQMTAPRFLTVMLSGIALGAAIIVGFYLIGD